jgi:uncharacterized membrane protein YoaK (UPF0700 family)
MMRRAAGELAGMPPALILLTVATGMVDAVSFLQLGHVFVANMTGNIAFLGFAVAGYGGISASGSIVALVAFLVGAFGGGKLAARSQGNAQLLLGATAVNVCLSLLAVALAALNAMVVGALAAYVLIALLGLAMGMQNAAARKLAVPDFTTTVLTLTITGIAADFGAGENPKLLRRLTSVIAMFSGAAIGAAFVLRGSVLGAVTVICLLFAWTTVLVLRARRHGQEALQ